jgi:hypothetical protein
MQRPCLPSMGCDWRQRSIVLSHKTSARLPYSSAGLLWTPARPKLIYSAEHNVNLVLLDNNVAPGLTSC